MDMRLIAVQAERTSNVIEWQEVLFGTVAVVVKSIG